jgi:lipoyl-dependent peroxiredoxin
MKSVYEAMVISQGGRNGRVRSSDGLLDVAVSLPQQLGGAGGATNPEQLFAAGYAACFENAVIHVARLRKQPIGGTRVSATVGLGAEPSGAFKLSARLEVGIQGIGREEALALIEEAHRVCPYSNATRGNIDVRIELATG